jgi:hypothetical protein
MAQQYTEAEMTSFFGLAATGAHKLDAEIAE